MFSRPTPTHRPAHAAIPMLLCLMLLATGSVADAQWESTLELIAPDASPVSIHRDDYGVPHIYGDTETGIFYAQGFAVAQDRLYQMEINRRAGLGRLAEMFGPAYVSLDRNTRKLYYTEAERQAQIESLPQSFRDMADAYVAGINAYLDSMEVDPGTYRPLPLASWVVEPWTTDHVVATTQYYMRQFGEFGGQELQRLAELENNGQAWFDANRPINDPTAPTTIPDRGRGPAVPGRDWSGQRVSLETIARISEEQSRIDELKVALGLPPKFGSFAVQITTEKSLSGNVLLLGCPQMGTPTQAETNTIHELELLCPTYHMGGMTVAGVPGVIIGHNGFLTWTLTSGISDNTDVYIETTQTQALDFYWHNDAWVPFEAIADTVFDNSGTPYPFEITRTVHGPVYSTNLGEYQAFTKKMTFWNNELEMGAALYDMCTARSQSQFEAALGQISMSFNVFYAGRNGHIKYWHAGWYQDRTDGIDPRLPHNGDGTEEWGGLRDFADLPVAENPAQGYFVNWNNKPVVWWDNGDNVPWSGWHPVMNIDNYVSALTPFDYDDLKETPHAIGSHGTYQQAIELGPALIVDENIVPPGQSAFVSLAGVPSPHVTDQWPLHVAWQFKDQIYAWDASAVDDDTREEAAALIRDFRVASPLIGQGRIAFNLRSGAQIHLDMFDAQGRIVRQLLSEHLEAGSHQVSWDGRDLSSNPLPSGIYWSRLQADREQAVRGLLLLW